MERFRKGDLIEWEGRKGRRVRGVVLKDTDVETVVDLGVMAGECALPAATRSTAVLVSHEK